MSDFTILQAARSNIPVEAANRYVECGYMPIPLEGKAPHFKAWQQLRPADYRAGWFSNGYNVGLMTGVASGGLIVLDFDDEAVYHAFCKAFAQYWDTYTVRTGRGGYHVYLQAAGECPVNATIRGKVELKSSGCQVVAPPSIHPDTKKQYVVDNAKSVLPVTDWSDIVAWINSYRPQREWTAPKETIANPEDINPALKAALYDHFQRQPHAALHGDWINCSCPNPNAHKNGDQNPSFGYNTVSGVGNCYGCGAKNTKTLCELVGINPQDYGGLYPKTAAIEDKSTLAQAPVEVAPTAQKLAVVMHDNTLQERYKARLSGLSVIEGTPLVIPMKALHTFGGFAEVMMPGKVIGVYAASGNGKTTFCETWNDMWLRTGVHTAWWGQEWTPDEIYERRVQRWGGIAYHQASKWELYKKEKARGVPPEQRHGLALNIAEIERTQQVLDKLALWPGKGTYFHQAQITLENLLSHMANELDEARKRGQRIDVQIFDYLQLVQLATPDSRNPVEQALGLIKLFIADMNIVGVVASQVTKDGARAVKDGKVLDDYNAQFVRSDKFNLFISLNPMFDEDGKKLNKAKVAVTKNSTGSTGSIDMPINWQRLLWA